MVARERLRSTYQRWKVGSFFPILLLVSTIFDANCTILSAGVTSFQVDLANKKVVVVGDITPFEVLKSVSKVKFAELWLT